MTARRFDALVVGSGPAGSVAALVLARGGARVALVDKATFPRDKACGDLVGPRGVQTLAELGIPLEGPRMGDMEVVGPTGRRVVLPARPGRTYPGHAVVAPRARFDSWLRRAALEAGAEPFTGRAATPCWAADGQLEGFEVETAGRARRMTADVVLGADGALTRVGAVAGLVDERRVLWGFAARGYLPAHPPLPRIHFWEPTGWRGYPGYGWVFPGDPGQANVGIGAAARGERRACTRATRDLPAFLAAAGLDTAPLGRVLGGWLKLGLTGTVPAAGRTLLVGDAAGLVNALQGEGIAQALASGRAAAEAVLAAGPAGAARRYRAEVAQRFAEYAATTATVSGWALGHPRVIAALGRLLTAPGIAPLVAGGWALYWNDLLDGAAPGRARTVARAASGAGHLATARATDRHQVRASVADPG